MITAGTTSKPSTAGSYTAFGMTRLRQTNRLKRSVLATDLDQNPKLQAAGKQAAATLDPGKWIDESFVIAKQNGYSAEVLKKVADREGHSHLGPLDLSPKYTDAEAISEPPRSKSATGRQNQSSRCCNKTLRPLAANGYEHLLVPSLDGEG